jgi:hypothetical protein
VAPPVPALKVVEDPASESYIHLPRLQFYAHLTPSNFASADILDGADTDPNSSNKSLLTPEDVATYNYSVGSESIPLLLWTTFCLTWLLLSDPMDPPPEYLFTCVEALKSFVQTWAKAHGYKLSVTKSKAGKNVYLS